MALIPANPSTKERLHKILFERNTSTGRVFDLWLMVFIITSVLVVMLESVRGLQERYGTLFTVLEWVFTILFTIEYVLRLYSARNPLRYAKSFFGIIDLVSLLPTYVSAFFLGAHTFLIIRILRVFRIFRLFKLINFTRAGSTIVSALRASMPKIAIFLIFVLLLVTILGSLMYLIEGEAQSGFTSIPRSIYWAIVTLTTVGYGDIAPATEFGQFLAAIIMIMGYSVIAVPTGIVSAELVQEKRIKMPSRSCSRCGQQHHLEEARYCHQCALPLYGS